MTEQKLASYRADRAQRARKGSKATWVFLTCFALFWCALVGTADFFLVPAFFHQLASANYTATPAHIVGSKVTHHSGSHGGTHNFEVEYTYGVNGAVYTGHRYTFADKGSSDRAWADKAVQEFPPGSDRTCYYDPNNPNRAVLKRGIQGSNLTMLMFITPFNIIGALFIGYPISRFLNRGNEEFKPRRLDQFQNRESFSMQGYGGVSAFFATFFVTTFLGIFVVVFPFGFHPPIWKISAIWGTAFLISLLAAIYVAVNRRAGRWDLTIDRNYRTIILPAAKGRKAGETIPLSDAKTVEVTDVPYGDNNHQFHLHLETGSGTRHLIAIEYDQEKARQMAEAINRRLVSR